MVQSDGGDGLILRDTYDVPEDVAAGPHSPAFAKFLWNWFGDTAAVTHGELDLRFLRDLTSEELLLARQLIRRNLWLNQTHIIQGASALRDVDAVPILRELLSKEPDVSRRLVLAGALWKIDRDPLFVTCLDDARSKSAGVFSIYPHLLQVLWLDDERALDFLIGLLKVKDRMTQSFTLGVLNELEFGRRMNVPPNDLPHQVADYFRLGSDPVFRAQMTAAIRQRNAQTKNGW